MARRTHLPLTPTFLDGLIVVANAVPDLGLVIDCADCGAEKFSIIGNLHDWGSTLTNSRRQLRARFSGLRANDMVLGTRERLREAVLEVIAERKLGAVLLVQSCAVQLIGSDHHSIAEELRAETGIPILVVPPRPFTDDWSGGMSLALEVLAEGLPLRPASPDAAGTGIVGYPFDRAEEDEIGNVRELRRMVEALGSPVQGVWLDGGRTTDAAAIGEPGTLLALPVGRAAASRLARRTGARVVDCSLPVGLAGSAAWMRQLGAALGASALAERFVDRELERAVPKLERAVRQIFLGRSGAIVGAPSFVMAMGAMLDELGMSPAGALVLTRNVKLGAEVRSSLAAHAHEPLVVVDPSFPAAEQALRELRDAGRLDFVIGAGVARDACKPLGAPYLEVGYPCFLRHALFDAPWVGFRGTFWVASMLLHLLQEAEYRAF